MVSLLSLPFWFDFKKKKKGKVSLQSSLFTSKKVKIIIRTNKKKN